MSLGFLSPLVEAGEGEEEDKVRQGLQSEEACDAWFKGSLDKFGDGEEEGGIGLLLVLGFGLGHSEETHEDKDDLNLALFLSFQCFLISLVCKIQTSAVVSSSFSQP